MSLDDVKLHLIESMDDVAAFARWLSSERNGEEISFDTESTGLVQGRDFVRLGQVGDDVHGWAFEWHRWSGLFTDMLQRFEGPLVAHNAPFDWGMIHHDGIDIPRHRIRDTRPMCHIIDPTFSTALKPNAARYVDPRAGNAQKDLDEGISNWGWDKIPITFQPYWTYGALDPVLTQRLYNVLWPQINGHQQQRAYDIENSVQWVTYDMERYGVHIDTRYAQDNYERFVVHCGKIKMWCIKNFNADPGRNAQVIARLAGDGVEFTKPTKGGAVSLDSEVLDGIDHPLARQVLIRRKLEKLASTYLKHYITEVDADDFIHPSINTLGARTSRMSMSGPNFQNLPRVSADNPFPTVIRNCVTAREGHTLLFCDFSQIEMRILAWLAQDENMTAAFTSEGDFFVNLARQVYGDPTIIKGDPRRDTIKTMGYAKIYGAGLAKIAWSAGVSIDVIRTVMNDFDSRFSGVRTYQTGTYNLGMRRKMEEGEAYAICPLTGRRQPAAPGKEYALVNSIIQGAAASLFKMKLLELDDAGLGPWMMLPVHDEIILDVPDENVIDAVNALQTVMNDTRIISPVPVEAEVSFGHRWGSKMKWDEERWRKGDWRNEQFAVSA